MLKQQILSRIKDHDAGRLIVGFSGGMDSHALLHCLASEGLAPRMHALHVNHGLSPLASEWQAHCERVSARLGVAFTALCVDVAPGAGVEERARDARYEAFESFLEAGDLLLLAHHADDQVETLLMTLLRGGNGPGLSGMPRQRRIGRAHLFRPLLDVERDVIEQYAVSHDLTWVYDASNQDTGMTRNYVRHRLMPVIRARWPDAAGTLLKQLARTEEFSELVDYIGKTDLASLMSARGGVSAGGLAALPAARARNAVRSWAASFDLPLPGDAALSALPALLTAAEDAAPLLCWQGVCLRRAGGEVFMTAALADFDSTREFVFDGADVIDTGTGTLTARCVEGRGLLLDDVASIRVAFRQGGEKLRMGRNRTLKNVLQEAGVPAWLRERLPLIYQGDTLVAVAGLPAWNIDTRVAGRNVAKAGEKGFEFCFEVPGHPYTH